MRFQATIRASGKTATGIPVPPAIVDQLGAGKRPPVRVTLNGYTYRTTVASMGGEYLLSLSAEHRTGSGAAAGDEVTVDIELDTAPREVAVPPDLAAALDRDPAAKAFFAGLSYSNRLRHVLAIEGAKTEATRQRRIGKAVDLFREGRV